jgi:hypothetical protein
MSVRKIPDDAFALYVAMGHERSHQALADKLGVTKRAITERASEERWAERLEAIEAEVQARIEEKLKDELEESQLRYRKLLRGIESRAAQVIAEKPLRTCLEGVRALELAMKMQMLLAGQPSQRTELVVAATTKAEIDRLLERKDEVTSDDDW